MTTPPSPSGWVVCPRPNAAARFRLFCLPYAGGGASVYQTWWNELPAQVEVCAIQPPGRESRIHERPFQRLTPLVHALADAIGPSLSLPFAFFGHSVGALVSFALVRELRRRGAAAPAHLFVSARRAPHLPDPDPLHRLSEKDFVAGLRRMEGTPEAVLQEPELMALFLPILRADLGVNEAEEIAVEEPLDCPISAFGGLGDGRASSMDIDAWRQHTRRDFTLEMFPGGHFYLRSARGGLLRSVSRSLQRILDALPEGQQL
jgi:medium-chain acyl-[acyl-carrier-protein] hydrolase